VEVVIAPDVIPAPVDVVAAGGELRLDVLTAISVSSPRLLAVAERFQRALRDQAGIVVSAISVDATPPRAAMRIELREAGGRARTTRGLRADGARPDVESYRLVVSDDGVVLVAATEEGLHRGLTSIVQLSATGDGVLPCGTVDDAPEFAWRGLSLDVVRTFVPVDEVKRVIDMLSLYKLNVLHLHLTDNEGWRLEIDAWPRLTEVASGGAVGDRAGGFYTKQQFRELVAYARERFVTIVPEIDLPGHAAAALAAYPELGPAKAAGAADSIFPVAHLDIASEHVWRFVRDVMTEVAAVAPGAFIHIGGDEAFGMDEVDHAEFVDRTIAIVNELGKRAVGWQETCRAGVGPDEVMQHWIAFTDELDFESDDSPLAAMIPPDLRAQLAAHFRTAARDLARIAEKGAGLLLSPTSHLYLDRPHGDPSTRPEQEQRRANLGLAAYPPMTLEAMFDWDPREAAPDVAPAAIVGVEAAMWCETVETMDDLEVLLLPRLAGVAELAWSPSHRTVWADHRRRLAAHAPMWHRAGWAWYHADSVDWPQT
jgi:hexosaminidase